MLSDLIMDEKRNFDEEEKFYKKYIKPQYTILKRIKRKIFGPYKRMKTVDDVVMLDMDLIMKLFCLLMIYLLIKLVCGGILDLYLWFFPPAKEIVKADPFFHTILYMFNGLI